MEESGRSPKGKELKKTGGPVREKQRQMGRGGVWSVDEAVSRRQEGFQGSLRSGLREEARHCTWQSRLRPVGSVWEVCLLKKFIYFSLKDNCFTVLCWVLPCINMN